MTDFSSHAPTRSVSSARRHAPGELWVHPVVSPRYYRYYLDGLEAVFGRKPKLRTKGFPELRDPKNGMAVILPNGQRLFIAANDFAVVDPAVVAWADVVGQVNVDPGLSYSPKVVPIGPSFGLPWSSRASLAAFVIRSGAMTDPSRVPAMLRDYLRANSERAPLSAYTFEDSADEFVFFVATYWRNAPSANERRLRFLRAVQRRPGLQLGGGFWSREELPTDFGAFQLTGSVDHREYLRRTKASTFVFNTPAVHDCLGWKLGEFLALGKAIISTPLGRTMPGDFRSGEQIHIVDGSEESIFEAVDLLHHDREYRRHLEESARRYWEQFLRPDAVIRILLDHSGRAEMGSSPMSVVGEHDEPRRGLRREGVEVPEDQGTFTSPEIEDLDDERAYVVLPCRGRLLPALRSAGRPGRAAHPDRGRPG